MAALFIASCNRECTFRSVNALLVHLSAMHTDEKQPWSEARDTALLPRSTGFDRLGCWRATMPQSMSQGNGWDLLAIIPGVLAAASLISLLFIWIRESLRHFANDPREYFLAAFWSFAIVGTGLALFGVTAKT